MVVKWHFVLVPSWLLLLLFVFLLSGLAAVTQTLKRNTSCLLSDDGKVSFVTVFVPRRKVTHSSDEQRDDARKLKFGNHTVYKDDRSYVILTILSESIQISMPGSKLFILSDPVSKFPVNRLPRGVAIHGVYGNYAVDNLMLQRVQSYIVFLQNIYASSMHGLGIEEVPNHVIFLDSDIMIVGDLGCIFKENHNFDIALTFRNNKGQPVNSGVILVRGNPTSISRARSFLENVVKVYKAKFKRAAGMLGDQLSLAWIVQNCSGINQEKIKRQESFQAKIEGTEVLFLPGVKYNWTPAEGAGQFHGMPDDVQVIHFKGSRKRLMIEAWNFFKISGKDFSDMKCLILNSGRTKYDF
eukprot:c24156_g1_i4 orf=321-1382(-)